MIEFFFLLLGSESASVRELAESILISAPEQPTLRIGLSWAARHPDPEIRIRWANIRAARLRACRPPGPWPWIDQLPEDQPHRRAVLEHYLARAREEHHGCHRWPEYRAAMRSYCEDLHRQGYGEDRIRWLLWRAWLNEIFYP